MLLSQPDLMEQPELFDGDVERFQNLPEEAIGELRDYLQRLLAGETNGDSVCLWLDPATKQCRHYDLRPSICRDLERNSQACHAWREDYGIR